MKSEAARGDRLAARPVHLELSGEFDVRYQKILGDIMSASLASGRPTVVDLSGVTFIDARCVLELAVHYQLGEGSVALCDPSEEVELGVAACDLGQWIEFVYTSDLGLSARRYRSERLL